MDDATLHQLYERFGYLVYRRCRALLGQHADAEDAMHEVFVRAHRHEPNLAEGPLAWLYTVATSVCIDFARKRGRAQPTDPETLARVDPRVVAVDGDRQALLGRALRELDETVCQVGLLHHLGGLTQDEVGAQLKLSRRTVGKKLQHFDEALRGWANELRGDA